jgi:hypothetical protein
LDSSVKCLGGIAKYLSATKNECFIKKYLLKMFVVVLFYVRQNITGKQATFSRTNVSLTTTNVQLQMFA